MQDVSQEKYHQLQTAPMGKLVLQYSIPAIINMAAVSLYNLIDSIFIGNGVGTLAISGLAVTFPMMNCLIAFNTLVGIGGTTLTSISLGRRQYEQAADILHTVVIFGFVISVLTDGSHISIWMLYCTSSEPVKPRFRMHRSTLRYCSAPIR